MAITITHWSWSNKIFFAKTRIHFFLLGNNLIQFFCLILLVFNFILRYFWNVKFETNVKSIIMMKKNWKFLNNLSKFWKLNGKKISGSIIKEEMGQILKKRLKWMKKIYQSISHTHNRRLSLFFCFIFFSNNNNFKDLNH